MAARELIKKEWIFNSKHGLWMKKDKHFVYVNKFSYFYYRKKMKMKE